MTCSSKLPESGTEVGFTPGELAWLRPSSDAGEPDDALYVLTDRGRRALAEAALFGPWPTVAEASAA